jgi:phosphoserine phosphatase
MDSTFIQQEVIDLLAAAAGVGAEVVRITELSMRGEIDFATSLKARVSLLAGLPTSVFDDVRSQITLSLGAETLVKVLHGFGDKVAIVSGGFEEVISPILRELGVDFIRANHLEVVAGQLTGRTMGPIIDRTAKAHALTEFAESLEIPLTQTVAVGDGANDLGMMALAGLSIAFNAKPIVQATASESIVDGDLVGVLHLMGFTDSQIAQYRL